MTRFDMTTREWHELVKPVLPHASADREVPELAVVRLEAGTEALYAVATDRYTLAASRWPLPREDRGRGTGLVVHLDAKEAAASLRLFTFSRDEDPPLMVIIDEAVTVEQPDDGTRLMLHDTRDPFKDPLAGWRKALRAAMARGEGRPLEGLDLHATMLSRWAAAARKGERLTVYTGPDAGDPLLVTVEEHFAGLWIIPQYLDAPGKTLAALPWHAELDPLGDDAEAGLIDAGTGERRDGGDAP